MDHGEAQATAQRDWLLAEQRADSAEKEFSSAYYQRAFSGPSLGTEEELGGVHIKMKMTAPHRVVAMVARAGTPLVLITRDMMFQPLAEGYGEYTIELRTTPALISDPNMPGTEWEYRRRALQVAIWAIESRTKSPLVADDWHGFQTYILNSDHSFIRMSSTGDVTGSDKQATFGIPAGAIATASRDDRAAGQLHPHVQVPWYRDQFTADLPAAQYTPAERATYAVLMSAALKLTRLPREKSGDETEVRLYRTTVKDAWQVRPRTPPVKVLDIFLEDRKEAVKQAFARSASPTVDNKPTAQDWEKYVGWITDGRALGGHTPPDCTINGTPAMLFEYRTAPAEKYPYAFWRPDEWTTDTF